MKVPIRLFFRFVHGCLLAGRAVGGGGFVLIEVLDVNLRHLGRQQSSSARANVCFTPWIPPRDGIAQYMLCRVRQSEPNKGGGDKGKQMERETGQKELMNEEE